MMRLPAIEIPETTSDASRQWAYRIGTLPFGATVDHVAMLIEAARQEAVREIGSGNQATPEHSADTRRSAAPK